MKYLLVLAVIVIAFLAWRAGRGSARPRSPGNPREEPRAIEMVRCDLCGVHCPKTDALAGRRGLYCTAQHRSQAEP